jgi:hypothetical protein
MRKLLALNDMATAKKQYKDMRLKCGKPESSFAYLFDKALQAVGARVWHTIVVILKAIWHNK